MASNLAEASYGDVHRAFLQTIMVKGVMTGKEVFAIFGDILKEYQYEFDPDDRSKMKTDLQGIIVKINRQVRPLGMEIRRCLDERNGIYVFALLNRIESPSMMHALKDYTPNEMEYFKLMLSVMFDEEDRYLSMTQCLNLTTNLLKRMSMEDGERFLERLMADSWLEKANGKIHLHVRGVHELETYLKAAFGLQDCHICKSVVVMRKGQECSECETQVHSFCISKQPRRQCPNEDCRVAWPAVENASQSTSHSSQSISQRSSTSHKRIKMDNSDSDNEQNDANNASQPRKKK